MSETTDAPEVTQGPPRGGQLLGEAIVLDDLGPPRRNRMYPAAGAASLLLAPAAMLLVWLVLLPVGRTVHASLTEDGRFVGLSHLHTALVTDSTSGAIWRTVLWAVVIPLVVTATGFFIAVAGRNSRWSGAATALMVAPVAMPLVVTGVTFRILYDPDPHRGLGTRLVRWLAPLAGRSPEEVPPWLGPQLITLALATAFTWAWVGIAVVVFRAALHAIPQTLVDAVRANGGSTRDIFLDAMWRPLVRRTTAIVFALVVFASTRVFDLVITAAPGSAVDDASVLAVSIWQADSTSSPGPAAALGVLWLATMAVSVVVAAIGYHQAWPAPMVARTEAARFTADFDHGRGTRDRLLDLARSSVPVLVVMLWTIPFVGLLGTSLHPVEAAATRGWWHGGFGLGSYQKLFSGSNVTDSLVFTGLLAICVTAIVLVVASLAACALAWLLPRGARWVGLPLMAAAVVPVQVIAGPLNEVLAELGITAALPRLALVHIALGVPLAVLILRNTLADIPIERFRSTRVDGRWDLTMVWRLLHATGPAVVTVAVLELIQVWNDCAIGLFFSGGVHLPLGALLFGQVRDFVSGNGPLAAGCVVAAIPPLLLVVLTRRLLVRGLVSGATP
jgi:alpha-glucoside transport system permease protein